MASLLDQFLVLENIIHSTGEIGPSAFPGIGQDPPRVSHYVLNSSSWNVNNLRTLSINGGRIWFFPRNSYVSFSAETQGSEGQNPHVKEGGIWELL